MSEEKPLTNEQIPDKLAMQTVIVTLNNGKRGAFIGPELISSVELLLNPPSPVSIDFLPPRVIQKGPEDEPKKA